MLSWQKVGRAQEAVLTRGFQAAQAAASSMHSRGMQLGQVGHRLLGGDGVAGLVREAVPQEARAARQGQHVQRLLEVEAVVAEAARKL